MKYKRLERLKELLRQYGVKSYMSVLEYLVATRLPRITRLYRVLVLPNGLKILIPELEDYYKSIIASYGEVYIQGMYRRRREYLPREGQTVIDVGAFTGLYTLDAAYRVGGSGAVYSFEPNPLSFYILSLNIKLNRLENVKAHQVALSRHEGCAFMSYSEMPIFFSTYSDGKQKVKVRTSTLDAFISNADVDKVDVIKIDAEGFELDILLGGHLTLERGAASRLIIEAHRIIYGKRVYEVKQLVALLSEHGYLIDLIDDVDAYTSIIYARHHR